jgi:DNA-binding transcriptional LysR family regulator
MLTSIPLFRDELVLVLAQDHPFSSQRFVRLPDLATEHIIMFRPSAFEEMSVTILARAGVDLNAVMELDSIDAAKRMVEHSLGLALLPRSAVEEELRAGALVSRRIVGVASLERRILALRRHDVGDLIGPSARFLDPYIVYGDEREFPDEASLPLYGEWLGTVSEVV